MDIRTCEGSSGCQIYSRNGNSGCDLTERLRTQYSVSVEKESRTGLPPLSAAWRIDQRIPEKRGG